MRRVLSSVAFHIKVNQATIKHFCKGFDIDYNKQVEGKQLCEYKVYRDILKVEFINYLVKNKSFLQKYEGDYYKDKTPEIIGKTVNQHIKVIDMYLKCNYKKYYPKGVFTATDRYTLRYVSSYVIDYELGGDYDFLKYE